MYGESAGGAHSGGIYPDFVVSPHRAACETCAAQAFGLPTPTSALSPTLRTRDWHTPATAAPRPRLWGVWEEKALVCVAGARSRREAPARTSKAPQVPNAQHNPPPFLAPPNKAPLVDGVFGGVSATAMVYGVTGAGKSYTMVRTGLPLGGWGAGAGPIEVGL